MKNLDSSDRAANLSLHSFISIQP